MSKGSPYVCQPWSIFVFNTSTFTLLSVSAKGRVVYSRISCAVGNKELSCLALGLKAFACYVKDRHGVSEAFWASQHQWLEQVSTTSSIRTWAQRKTMKQTAVLSEESGGDTATRVRLGIEHLTVIGLDEVENPLGSTHVCCCLQRMYHYPVTSCCCSTLFCTSLYSKLCLLLCSTPPLKIYI